MLGLNIFKNIPATIILQDNKSAIILTNGGTCHKRSKHFGIEFDSLREYVALKELCIEYRDTDNLPADMLTKPLPPAKFQKFRDMVMGPLKLQNNFNREK